MNKIFIILIYLIHILTKCEPRKKNLILGAIKNYSWNKIKPFFVSLTESNFENYDCVMFVINISIRTIKKLKSIGVMVFEFPKKYRKIRVNNVRYKLYEEYLRDKLDKYNMVLHVDVRDSFFQDNIFKIYENKGPFIGFSLEDGRIEERINSGWISYQYGNRILEKIKNETIICSGIIWGTSNEFYYLIGNIWKQIESKFLYDKKIIDQSTTNYLIYYKKIFKGKIETSNNDFGYVMTLGLSNINNYSFDINENLLNFKAKKKVAIIHQYDRKSQLVEIVKRKFISKKESNLHLNYKIKDRIDEI